MKLLLAAVGVWIVGTLCGAMSLAALDSGETKELKQTKGVLEETLNECTVRLSQSNRILAMCIDKVEEEARTVEMCGRSLKHCIGAHND